MTADFSFLSARTADDWGEWIERNVETTEDGVTLAKTPTLYPTSLGFEAAAIGVHPNGNVGVLAPSGEVFVYVSEADRLRSLSLAGKETAGVDDATALGTMAEEIYLIDGDAGRVAAFSRRLRRVEWTADVEIDPITAVGSQRRVYVLDAAGEGGGTVRSLAPGSEIDTVLSGLVSPLDLSVTNEDTLFVLDEQDTADGESDAEPDGEPNAAPNPEPNAAPNPEPDGEYGASPPNEDEETPGYRLLRAESDVGVFASPTRVPLALPDGFEPRLFTAQTAQKFVFAGSDADGEPCLVRYELPSHTATVVSTLDREWQTLVSGAAGTDADSEQVFLTTESGDVWRLEERFDNRKDPENTRYEGRIVGRFDAGQRAVQWHRATLDIDQQGQDTRVDLNYYATDGTTEGVDDFSAIPEIEEYQRRELRAAGIDGLWDLVVYDAETVGGVLPETPTAQIADWIERAEDVLLETFEERSDVHGANDPDDILFTDATGRYLHVEVRFVGSRSNSPRLQSLTAYCPRQSYIRYLPEIYRERNRKSPFLSQFLSIFESAFVDIEQTLSEHTQYLDPETIPADYLSWLNGWLAVDLGETWPESARRELLARAPELYKRRGTRGGLLTMIELFFDNVETPDHSWDRALVQIERQLESFVEAGYLDAREAAAQIDQYRKRAAQIAPEDVYFFEHSQLEWIPDRTRREHYTRLIGHPRRFQVLLQPSVSDRNARVVREIVEAEMPVYTDADVERLQERFQLEGNTYLGINTVLPKETFEIGHSVLGQQTQLRPAATGRLTADDTRTPSLDAVESPAWPTSSRAGWADGGQRQTDDDRRWSDDRQRRLDDDRRRTDGGQRQADDDQRWTDGGQRDDDDDGRQQTQQADSEATTDTTIRDTDDPQQ
jgi:phage tail-like protein